MQYSWVYYRFTFFFSDVNWKRQYWPFYNSNQLKYNIFVAIDQVSGSRRDHFSHFGRHCWHIEDSWSSGLGRCYLVLSVYLMSHREFPNSRQSGGKNLASGARILVNPAFRVAVKSSFPPRYPWGGGGGLLIWKGWRCSSYRLGCELWILVSLRVFSAKRHHSGEGLV